MIIILNKKEKTVDEKITKLINFYLENKNYHNWERVYNYLEGLDKGYAKSYEYEHNQIKYTLHWMKSNIVFDMNDNDILFSDVDNVITLFLYFTIKSSLLINSSNTSEFNSIISSISVILSPPQNQVHQH